MKVLRLLIHVPTVELVFLKLLVSFLCNNVQNSKLLLAVGHKVDNSGTNVDDLSARVLRRINLV